METVTVTVSRKVRCCHECLCYAESREHGATIPYCRELIMDNGFDKCHIAHPSLIKENCPFRGK